MIRESTFLTNGASNMRIIIFVKRLLRSSLEELTMKKTMMVVYLYLIIEACMQVFFSKFGRHYEDISSGMMKVIVTILLVIVMMTVRTLTMK